MEKPDVNEIDTDTTQNSQSVAINDIPDELLVNIFKYTGKKLHRLSSVCNRWNSAIWNDGIVSNEYYKNLFARISPFMQEILGLTFNRETNPGKLRKMLQMLTGTFRKADKLIARCDAFTTYNRFSVKSGNSSLSICFNTQDKKMQLFYRCLTKNIIANNRDLRLLILDLLLADNEQYINASDANSRFASNNYMGCMSACTPLVIAFLSADLMTTMMLAKRAAAQVNEEAVHTQKLSLDCLRGIVAKGGATELIPKVKLWLLWSVMSENPQFCEAYVYKELDDFNVGKLRNSLVMACMNYGECLALYFKQLQETGKEFGLSKHKKLLCNLYEDAKAEAADAFNGCDLTI